VRPTGNGVLVVSLPVTDTVRPGRRRLETIGPARGRGGGEHPVRPPAA